jgi:hypothetical protein
MTVIEFFIDDIKLEHMEFQNTLTEEEEQKLADYFDKKWLDYSNNLKK